MKTNYEKIKAIIDSWHIAQVEHEDGGFELYSSVDDTSRIRCSDKYETLEECYGDLWSIRDDTVDINKMDIKKISVYQRPVRYPKVWDKVQLLDIFKETSDWCDKWVVNEETPYNVSEVRESNVWLDIPKLWICYFDYRVIAPRIHDEEDQEDILIKNWKKYRVQILEEIE